MSELRQCARCVMTWPEAMEIVFDDKGICNFCYGYAENERKRRSAKLHPGREWTIHKLKKSGEGKKYDCLIGLSGGADSSTCLHYIVKEWNLRPLCFSVDNGWNDKRADENIMRMVEKLKVPFHRYNVDLKEFSDLQVAFVRSGIKNIEIPTDHILMAVGYQLAEDNKIKYIVNGGNLATEGIMPSSYGEDPKDLRMIKAIFKKFQGRRLKNLPTISLLDYVYYRFFLGIKIIQPLDFYEYRRDEAIKLLEKEYGWKSYGEKHGESLFTRWFQNFYLPVKFGIDKRKPHLSSMINSGQMTKKEAMEILNTPLQYPELGIEKKVLAYPKILNAYEVYPNSQKARNNLSKFYGFLKRHAPYKAN